VSAGSHSTQKVGAELTAGASILMTDTQGIKGLYHSTGKKLHPHISPSLMAARTML
jgi:hypothetical protein